MPQELQKAYDPTAIEDRWATYWVSQQLFHTDSATHQAARAFTILLPPPNVTGNLHMGHMFEHAETDILVRWHRMIGDNTLWVPGTDHAGIATQMLVERQVATEGTSRQQMGPEAFVERVWQWRQHYGGAILGQMKRLGTSVDWSREYFTMDENLSVAVKEAFVRLYEQGLIYRGAYIVNWCPRCQTAISDLEVVHEEQQGKLWEIRYPILGDHGKPEPGQFLTIATTRPETMLGDTAVAVNPNDDRYKHLHGKKLLLPLMNREIPVITDSWVSPDFGTGAVKVTPAHDPNDFAIGERHGLPSISIMDDTAHINAEGGTYAGLDRYVARKRVVADLEEQGLLGTVRDHMLSIGKCDRCKSVVEPRLSTQWFVKIQPLADKAIAAVEQGYIKFKPAQYAKTYFEWMRNIHDWCISRQLWWGHRIPAWHCATCKQITVARETPAQCAHCGSASIAQETDVLDTWFSSGLLPFTVFGWPKRTRDLDTLYPTQLLITGFDILFFWVARMIMLGCHFMSDVPMPDGPNGEEQERDLKDTVPFREVYIHALVRDADRQKMSKTKGNVIDPIEIVQRYGTDAVRFTLAAMASPGTDIAFSEARTEGYRAFANKIWNAANLVFMNMNRAAEAGITVDPGSRENPGKTLEARWITSRLNSVAGEVNQALAEYRFDEAANRVYQFFWADFCDWYLEIVKLRLDFSNAADKSATTAALSSLVSTFESALRLLSPFMPFITEELWHALYDAKAPAKSIALTRYPQPDANLIDAAIESDMTQLQELIVAIRALRKDLEVPERELAVAEIQAPPALQNLATANREIVENRARISAFGFPEQWALNPGNTRVTANFTVGLTYEKQIDIAAERERLQKKLEQLEKRIGNSDRQLQNAEFLARAPEKIVTGLKKQAAEDTLLRQETLDAIEKLERLA
jgi:valyl-tRNA synthetase